MTSKLVVSCQLLIRFRHITYILLATFLWTPVCQTSAAKWLPRLIWKKILSTLCRKSIMKKLPAVFEKYYIKVSRVMSASDQISPNHIFTSRYASMNTSLSNQRAMLLWTPVCQTSAANWLTRLIWKEILSTLCKKGIMKKFEPFFRNSTSNKKELRLRLRYMGVQSTWYMKRLLQSKKITGFVRETVNRGKK